MRRSRLLGQEQKKKMFSQSTYEQICRKACLNPDKPRADETVEEAYWRTIYREAVHYLSPASPPYTPYQMENVPLKNKYQFNLAHLIDGNKSGAFNPIDIATRFIAEAMGKEES